MRMSEQGNRLSPDTVENYKKVVKKKSGSFFGWRSSARDYAVVDPEGNQRVIKASFRSDSSGLDSVSTTLRDRFPARTTEDNTQEFPQTTIEKIGGFWTKRDTVATRPVGAETLPPTDPQKQKDPYANFVPEIYELDASVQYPTDRDVRLHTDLLKVSGRHNRMQYFRHRGTTRAERKAAKGDK